MNETEAARGTSLPADKPPYRFELYMIGTTPSSARAIVNLRKICERYLKGRYDLSIIDVAIDRSAARLANIIAAPTLVVRSPLPEVRFIGDLSDEQKIVSKLALECVTA